MLHITFLWFLSYLVCLITCRVCRSDGTLISRSPITLDLSTNQRTNMLFFIYHRIRSVVRRSCLRWGMTNIKSTLTSGDIHSLAPPISSSHCQCGYTNDDRQSLFLRRHDVLQYIANFPIVMMFYNTPLIFFRRHVFQYASNFPDHRDQWEEE